MISSLFSDVNLGVDVLIVILPLGILIWGFWRWHVLYTTTPGTSFWTGFEHGAHTFVLQLGALFVSLLAAGNKVLDWLGQTLGIPGMDSYIQRLISEVPASLQVLAGMAVIWLLHRLVPSKA